MLTLPEIYFYLWFKLSPLVKDPNENSDTIWWYEQQVTAVVERLIGISPSMELIKFHREMILLLLVLVQVTSDHLALVYGFVPRDENAIGINHVSLPLWNLQRDLTRNYLCRHWNPIESITCSWSVVYKARDLEALVFDFMSRGSLENMLRERRRKFE